MQRFWRRNQKPNDGGKQATVPVESGDSGNYFDYELIPELKRRLLDRVDPAVSRKILTAGGSQLNDTTTEGLLKNFGIDNYVIRILYI